MSEIQKGEATVHTVYRSTFVCFALVHLKDVSSKPQCIQLIHSPTDRDKVQEKVKIKGHYL